MVENTAVNDPHLREEAPVAEHSIAVLYGGAAATLGALVWSGAAAVFGAWAVPAAFGVGWMAGWACRYGGRRADEFVRSSAWLLGAGGGLLGLLLVCAFSTVGASPDSGLQAEAVRAELLRYLSAPPWLGSAALLLALAGVSRSLRGEPAGATLAPAELGALLGAGGGGTHSGASAAPAGAGVAMDSRVLRSGASRKEPRAA
jgi:hypothetical protein